MKLKNKILALLLFALLAFSLVGCAKCISTEYDNVEVTVVDVYHRGTYVTPIRVGKVTSTIVHPAIWHTMVEYNSVEYTISGSDIYHKYKDKINQTAIGKLEIRTYDDGTVRYDIIGLE